MDFEARSRQPMHFCSLRSECEGLEYGGEGFLGRKIGSSSPLGVSGGQSFEM
jgi:hypothetical protein